MGHKNPKAKGSAYEREVCKKLSLFVSGMTRRDIYWRSAMSGGRSTVQRRKGEHHEAAGDICCTDPLGHWLTSLFVVECKRYADLELSKIFFGTKAPLLGFWETLLYECQGDRQPLLITKQNNQPEIVFTSEAGVRILRAGGAVRPHVIVPAKDMHAIFLADLLMLNHKRVRKVWELRAIRRELE